MALLLEKSQTLHSFMLKFVYDALQKHSGNRTRAAKELGITVRCLRYWIAKYDELGEFRIPIRVK